jgi:hypothetical protein
MTKSAREIHVGIDALKVPPALDLCTLDRLRTARQSRDSCGRNQNNRQNTHYRQCVERETALSGYSPGVFGHEPSVETAPILPRSWAVSETHDGPPTAAPGPPESAANGSGRNDQTIMTTTSRALALSDAATRGWITRRRRGALAGSASSARHYAYSIVGIRGEVAARVDYYLEVAPYLDVLVDGPALAAAARLGVQAKNAHAAIEDAEANKREVSESLRKHSAYLLQAELRALAACSLTPATRALLGLSRLDAQGRARYLAEQALDAYRSPKAER